MTTLREALTLASAYWDTKGGSTGTVMAMRVRQCVAKAGWSWDKEIEGMGPADGTHLLTALRFLALGSRPTYYAAFTRMLALAGKSTIGWPSGGTAPRRTREPMLRESALELREWFDKSDMPETSDLLTVLLGTGMRVEVEALSWDAWQVVGGASLRIIGKGGHERIIPIGVGSIAVTLNEDRINPMRRLSYSAHLKRWNRGVSALGITTRLPTPHAVRHLYATEAYERSGRNLNVVRELLGHADINTTARYIGVDMAELRQAAGAE